MNNVGTRFGDGGHKLSIAALAGNFDTLCVFDGPPLEASQLPDNLLAAVDNVQVRMFSDLLDTEQLLDSMAAAGMVGTPCYLTLTDKAESYIRENPELLERKWPRTDGAVVDLMQKVREDTSAADRLLSKYRLRQH